MIILQMHKKQKFNELSIETLDQKNLSQILITEWSICVKNRKNRLTLFNSQRAASNIKCKKSNKNFLIKRLETYLDFIEFLFKD